MRSRVGHLYAMLSQGFISGIPVFNMYIDDINDGIASTVLKLAQVMQTFGSTGTGINFARRHRKFNWSQEWQMTFSTQMCMWTLVISYYLCE